MNFKKYHARLNATVLLVLLTSADNKYEFNQL